MSKLPPAPSKKNKKLNNRGAHSIFDGKAPTSKDKKNEMFTSFGGSGMGTGVLRPVKGTMDKDAAANDPNFLNNMMKNQQSQGVKSDNKMDQGIYLYKNGYTIGEDGEFKSIENDENKKFIASIKKGEIPESLETMLKEKFGNDLKDIDVNVVNREKQDWTPKKKLGKKLGNNEHYDPNFIAFKGTGNKLESKNNNVNESLEDCQAKEISFDKNKETIRVQIILIDNKKITQQLNIDTTILQLYSHIKFLSKYDGNFYLLAGFPPKKLNNPKETVKEAGLKNARITQKKL